MIIFHAAGESHLKSYMYNLHISPIHVADCNPYNIKSIYWWKCHCWQVSGSKSMFQKFAKYLKRGKFASPLDFRALKARGFRHTVQAVLLYLALCARHDCFCLLLSFTLASPLNILQLLIFLVIELPLYA